MDVLAAVASAAAPAAPPAAIVRSRLSDLDRWSIISMHNDGRSNSYISRKLGVHRDVRAVRARRFDATGSPGSGSRSGRPRVTDEALNTAIAFTAHTDVFTTPRQIVRKLNLDISPRTVDRRLQDADLFGRIALHKRVFSEVERRKRLAFAEGYKRWTADQWGHVLFSDEKCFYGRGFCGQVWVRRPKGEALNPKYIAHTTAHSVKVNVWGCFCARGQGYIHIFNETLDAALQKRILSANLLPSAHLHYASDPPEQWYFLHDNDKKFKGGIVQGLLHNLGVTLIDFPPYSPDLNPMENLWATMARAVEKYQCETLELLQDAVAEEWKKLDPKHMKRLVDSMPQRCQAVIDAQGHHTTF
jgi:transposase